MPIITATIHSATGRDVLLNFSLKSIKPAPLQTVCKFLCTEIYIKYLLATFFLGLRITQQWLIQLSDINRVLLLLWLGNSVHKHFWRNYSTRYYYIPPASIAHQLNYPSCFDTDNCNPLFINLVLELNIHGISTVNKNIQSIPPLIKV